MSPPYRMQRRVEFRDTDAAGIAHFSMFFLYMEEAEHGFLRQLGLSVKMSEGDDIITWPRVAARCDYQTSVKFEDVLDIEVHVVRVGRKSVTYEFSFTHDESVVASGEVTAVCCRWQPGGPLSSISIPGWIAERLTSLPAG